jgi:Fe-S-cluster containining protein
MSTGLGLSPMVFLEIYGAKDYDRGICVDAGLLDLALKQNDGRCMFLEESQDIFRCTVNDIKPGVCKSYPFQLKAGKLIQMPSKMCPVDWNTGEFEAMMTEYLKKDEDEWKFYDRLVLEWNYKQLKKRPLSDFLKFLMHRVSLELKKSP